MILVVLAIVAATAVGATAEHRFGVRAQRFARRLIDAMVWGLLPFIAFFVMLIFLLMSGLFTPVDSMPDWAQRVAEANPVKHFVFIMRSVLVRGAGLETVGPTIVGLAVAGAGVLALAVLRYRKSTA